MFDDRLSVRVGTGITLALIAGVVIALTRDPQPTGPSVAAHVFMAHPGALQEGARIQLGGRRIGTVEGIRLVTGYEARGEEHPLHPIGGVVLSVRVRTRYTEWVRTNSELFVNQGGIVGEAYLEVAPPPGELEPGREIRDGDALRGIDPARMELIIVASFNNAQEVRELLRELEPSLALLRRETQELAQTFAEFAPASGGYQAIGTDAGYAWAEWTSLTQTIEQGGAGDIVAIAARAESILSTAERSLRGLRRQLREVQVNLNTIEGNIPSDLRAKLVQAAESAKSAAETSEKTLSRFSELARRVRAGSGTVGALINDPEFSDDAKQLGRYIKRHPWEFLLRPVD